MSRSTGEPVNSEGGRPDSSARCTLYAGNRPPGINLKMVPIIFYIAPAKKRPMTRTGLSISSRNAAGAMVLLFLLSGTAVAAHATEMAGNGRAGDLPAQPSTDSGCSVNLTTTPEKMHRLMYVHPNGTGSANVTLSNPGGLDDRSRLEVGADFRGHPGGVGPAFSGSGWKVWLGNGSTPVPPRPLEQVNATVFVRGPRNGSPNDYITVFVNATSGAEPGSGGKVQFRVYLVIDHKIQLKCEDKVHTTSDGIPTKYKIWVTNPGDSPETVFLSARGPSAWNCELDRLVVELDPGENTTVFLTVTPPEDGRMDEVGVVTVTAQSKASPTTLGHATTHTVISCGMFMDIYAPNGEAFVEPGCSQNFQLLVTIHSPVHGTIPVLLRFEIVSASGNWDVYLTSSPVGVAGGETKSVNLTVTAPLSAPAGARLVVRVLAFKPGRPAGYCCLLTAVVPAVHDIKVSVAPGTYGTLWAYPGETIAYDLIVFNNGNVAEELLPCASEFPAGWDLTCLRPEGSVISAPDRLLIQPGEIQTLTALVEVGAGAIAGTYISRVMLADGNVQNYTFELQTTVRQVFTTEVKAPLARQTVLPGRTACFTMMAWNEGNGLDVLSFGLNGLPDGWTGAGFRDWKGLEANKLALDARSIGRLDLFIPVPVDTGAGDVGLVVKARSSDGTIDTVPLVLELRLPNLLISNLVYAPGKPEAGKPAIVTATVSNSGAMDAEDVTVRLYYGGKAAGEVVLKRVPGATNLTVTFSRAPSRVIGSLTFVVDPDNRIAESNELDNKCTGRVIVCESRAHRVAGFEAPALLIAVAVLLVRSRLKQRPAPSSRRA